MTTYVSFALQLSAILVVATALAAWCGWGLSRLALPAPLRPYADLFAPLVGYALVVVVGYWAVRTVSGLGPALVVLISVTGALNVAAWRRRASFPSATLPELLPLLMLLLLTLIVGVAPLLNYGHSAIVGAGWDTENYLPTARYLERGPVSAIATAPENPLRDINARPPAIGLTLGFSVWHGSVNLLARAEALVSFAPLLAWLRALGVLAVFLLLRTTLGLGRLPALLGAFFASASALLLWVSYFNFGMQLAAWPLIPLGLALGASAVEDLVERRAASIPGLLPATVALAALPVTYYPALTLFAPLAAGIGVATLIERRADALRLAGAASLLVVLTLLLAAPTLVDYTQGFNFRYGEQLTTLGVFHFISAADTLGLTPFSRGAAEAPSLLQLLGAVVAGGLALAGLALGPRRDRWLGMALATLAVLLWLRYVRAYPYAYMKTGAYAGWVFLGLAAAGAQGLWQYLRPRWRPLVLAPAALICVLLTVSQARIVHDHWGRPGLFDRELPALMALRELVPAGSTVTMTSDPRAQGVSAGLAAYLLDHARVIGRVRTGYASSQAGESGEIGEFGLLYASEEPEPWGFHDAIWRGGSFALYRRPERTRAHLRLDQTLPPGQTLALSLGADDVAFAPADLAGGQPRSATISVATLRASAIEIDGRVSSLAPGVTALHLGDYATPGLLTLRNVGGEPVLVRYLTLAEPAPDALAQEDGDHAGIVARAVADAQGSSVTARIETLLPDSGPLVVSLDVWDTDVGVQYGWYGATLSPRQDAQELVLTLNLQTGAASAVDSGGAQLPIGVHFGGLRPGTYTGRFYVGAEALPLLPPADIFQFRVERDGSVRVEWVDDTSLLAASVERPATRADAWVADDVRLQGYTLLTEAPAPGGEVLVALWWQCVREALDERSVLVHVLDSRGERVAQGDGPPATGILPTTQWREGDLVLDVRRVRLPEGLPPGPYTLAVGMYRWPSLERLPLTVASGRASDDVIRIPIQVDQER